MAGKPSPKNLFLIDGLGALLSAFLLGIVLVQFERHFGMPRKTLYILAAVPCFFALFDFYCYFVLKNQHKYYLRFIAIANLFYCVLSIAFLIKDRNTLTYLGWTYFILEIIIINALIVLEFKASKK